MLRTSVTILLFAGLSVFLSGCLAYDAAATVVGAGASAVGTVGEVAASPFEGGDAKSR